MGAEIRQITVTFTVPDADALRQRGYADLYPDDVAARLRERVAETVADFYAAQSAALAGEPDVS
jgi:hypothetical protein